MITFERADMSLLKVEVLLTANVDNVVCPVRKLDVGGWTIPHKRIYSDARMLMMLLLR